MTPFRRHSFRVLPAFVLLICNCIAVPAQERPQRFRDQSLPVEQRVDDLVSRMTLEEKVSQMQDVSPVIPRLGVPEYNWWNEALHGVARAGVATVFPQAIGMAATWDKQLLRQVGDTISTEARAKYYQAIREGNHQRYFGLTYWSPNINIFRDPRWGRGQETFGEDPYLTSRLGVEFVRGLQGDDPAGLKVVATLKHFAVHSGPEPSRHEFNVNVSPRDLQETYLPAFRATVEEAHAASIMCAYNAIDGKPACANDVLLNETLRKKWGFQGAVVSDCGAIRDIFNGHKFAPDREHAAAVALRAGDDLSCGPDYQPLVNAVRQSLVSEAEIDAALKRLFTLRFRLGMFDSVPASAQISITENHSKVHAALALQSARESMVLLKNNGVLPLQKSVKSIAIVGPNADSLTALLGNYHGTPAEPITPAKAMGARLGTAKIMYAQGSPLVSELAVPTPRSLFHNEQGDGLRAEYFNNAELSGKPAFVTTDANIDFDWNAATPHEHNDIDGKAFSVRWTGTMTAPAAGKYTFSIGLPHCYPCGDTEVFRVYLDEKLVAEQTLSGSPRRAEESAPFQMEFADTKPHAFKMEYSHMSPLFGAGITLNWRPPVDVLRAEAVKLASQADVVIAVVGLTARLEGEEMKIHIEGFNSGDRTDITLPKVQEQLLEALASTGKPLVVVLMNGSALAVNWAQQHADAILEAWYPGEAGGTAVVETLLGDNNPSGRLPVTFYKALADLPAFDDYSMKGRTYRYFEGKPLYGFGYGLSYSKFKYGNIRLSRAVLNPGDELTVEADVQNVSTRAGDEVAQLYLSYPEGENVPVRALQGFSRIHLKPGEVRRVIFHLDASQLESITEKGERVSLPGTYSVLVGGGQPEDGAPNVKQTFEINAAPKP